MDSMLYDLLRAASKAVMMNGVAAAGIWSACKLYCLHFLCARHGDAVIVLLRLQLLVSALTSADGAQCTTTSGTRRL